MLVEKKINQDGVDLTVKYDLGGLQKSLDKLGESFEPNFYTTMLSVDEGTVSVDVFNKDIAKGDEFLQRLSRGEFDIEKAVSKIRKKKNKTFWSKSGHDVLVLENISTYFTDFTNAWSVHVFRLEVLDEKTCELVLRERTYTV